MKEAVKSSLNGTFDLLKWLHSTLLLHRRAKETLKEMNEFFKVCLQENLTRCLENYHFEASLTLQHLGNKCLTKSTRKLL